MSDIIHLLPDSVANQIAAGEVIQRPASVLKELIENAIDAGATAIHILVRQAGKTLIQVSDNGRGMSETDARMAFERHTTSKIRDASDLFVLNTLGFRGEALASIAAVAQVEMHTRREEDDLGTLIEIAASRVFRQEIVQCAKGTTFQVKNLFFNVPARRRFLKSDNAERNHLLQEFFRIALAYPQIEFEYYDDQTLVYQLASTNTKCRIEAIFGKSQKKKWEQQLLTVEVNSTLVTVRGFAGKPEFAQRTANQYFFVNKRYMRHPYFHRAVMMAYDRLLQPNENPNYFIYFELSPETIDVNIHPAKTEIKFENESAIFSILSAAVKQTLGKFHVAPSLDFNMEGAPDFQARQSKDFDNIRPPVVQFNPAYNPFNTANTYKRDSSEWEKLYRNLGNSEKPDEKIDFADSNFDPDVLQHFEKDSDTDFFQLKSRFIAVPTKSGLLIVEQHRAHIRILFDKIMAQLTENKPFSQQVMFPEEICFDAADLLFFADLLPELEKAGFVFTKTGDNTFIINGIPSVMNTCSAEKLLHKIIDDSKNTQQNSVSSMHEIIALSLAETAAIRAGQTLAPAEMKDLVQRLFECKENVYSPEGKRVIEILGFAEIEKRFE
ncbi:MAG: DNA mismatch repair endonuclease MutL [Prevotellaceae bacterium]|nr:DNA mismatch repair endonuclease MutL [Prevotellaceae bacterium]